MLPLPVAGLMATGTCEEVGHAYGKLDKLVKAWGSPLRAPYMTLSFMALLVIPALKLSDRGLFDGAKFEFTDLLNGEADLDMHRATHVGLHMSTSFSHN